MDDRSNPLVDEHGAVIDELLSRQMTHLLGIVFVTVGLAGFGVVLLGNLDVGDELSVGYPVALAGTVGGTANAFRRIQRLQATEPEELRQVPPRLAIGQLYLSPVIGALFAVVLYGIFLSGLLTGTLLPQFDCDTEPFETFSSFSRCGPATNADVAKAMVWGFLAGFGEHFVPNVLDDVLGRHSEEPTEGRG